MIKYERPTEDDVDELAELWLSFVGEQHGSYNPNVDWWKERFSLLIGSDDYVVVQAKDEDKTIVFNLSGHGLLDLLGYQKYLSNELS